MKTVIFGKSGHTVLSSQCNIIHSNYGVDIDGVKLLFTRNYELIDPAQKFRVVRKRIEEAGSTSDTFECILNENPSAKFYEFKDWNKLLLWAAE